MAANEKPKVLLKRDLLLVYKQAFSFEVTGLCREYEPFMDELEADNTWSAASEGNREVFDEFSKNRQKLGFPKPDMPDEYELPGLFEGES